MDRTVTGFAMRRACTAYECKCVPGLGCKPIFLSLRFMCMRSFHSWLYKCKHTGFGNRKRLGVGNRKPEIGVRNGEDCSRSRLPFAPFMPTLFRRSVSPDESFRTNDKLLFIFVTSL
jgi:hypothetical protein